MQAAKSWHGYDSATYIRVLLWFTTRRCTLCKRKMRAVLVIITDVLAHQPLQMPLVQYDHMIEEIPVSLGTVKKSMAAMASE